MELKSNHIALQATDVSGQKVLNVTNVSGDSTVGELVQALLSKMKLPKNDVSGHPLTYHALLEREGRHLHASEPLNQALKPSGDRVVLQPNIDAGSSLRRV